eukprot:SAG11_NODE_955_length_6395_cov_7.590534_4_plen_70_part_00
MQTCVVVAKSYHTGYNGQSSTCTVGVVGSCAENFKKVQFFVKTAAATPTKFSTYPVPDVSQLKMSVDLE